MFKTVAGAVATAAAAGLAMLLGAGTANAVPDVVDRTYNDAKNLIQQAGGTPVIATRTGAGLDDGNCLVANAWDAGYQRIVRGGMQSNNEVLLALNCNGEVAGPGSSGNSAASPAGRAAKTEAEQEAADQEERELALAETPNE